MNLKMIFKSFSMSSILMFGLISNSHAVDFNLGVFALDDFRDQAAVNSTHLGIIAAALWGDKDLKYGLGAFKGLQKVNGVNGGYETLTLNLHWRGFFINPFLGMRAIKTSQLLKSNNIYPTKGLLLGYDHFLSQNLSLNGMGVYENPGKLDKDKSNHKYFELDSSLGLAVSVKYWF